MRDVIDVHCHLATPASQEAVTAHFRPEYQAYDHFMGEASRAHNREMFPTIRAPLTDPAARIEHMDRMGVDVQGLATFVSEYAYWAPATAGAEAARIQNDRIAQAVAEHPDRLAALGATVPLQDVDRAIAEMDRAVGDLGFKGLQIGGTIAGHNLDEPRFRPFWAAVEDRQTPVILHPSGYPEGDRLGDYFLVNCIGNPLETTVAVTRLIFSGLFEEHPGIRLVLLHGGGYLPFYAARSDHTWKVRPEARTHIPEHPPSHYLRQMYFDSMVFQPTYLRHLIDIVGPERVMLGTDFPFDMGEEDPVGLVDSVDGLDGAARAAIKGGTARALFGLRGRDED